MRRRAFALALLLPLAVTAVTLASVARNRSGGREAMVLSEREVLAAPRSADDTVSAVWLAWHAHPMPILRAPADRTLPRQGFAALELDGPAFRALPFSREDDRERASRLVVVDADVDADVLAARYPDGRTHLITAATLRLVPGQPYSGALVVGIEPQRIHVPREWAAELPRDERRDERARTPFDLEIRYGLAYEPWVTRIAQRVAAAGVAR